jgi:hypothetical protein
MKFYITFFLPLTFWLSVFAERPNVLVFIVDDLGYMDIGANNPDCFYETPHIDKLAATGHAIYRWICG